MEGSCRVRLSRDLAYLTRWEHWISLPEGKKWRNVDGISSLYNQPPYLDIKTTIHWEYSQSTLVSEYP